MIKKLVVLFLLLSLVISTKFSNVVSATGENSVTGHVEAKQLDKNAEILAFYLSKQNSPLQYHSQDFIDAAKAYNLDWRLVPAIAGVESTFGKQIPGGYNAWGWGVYGNQAIFFGSWKEAIYTISKGLRENYLDKGYTEPFSINRIYAESPNWGSRVTHFMEDLEKYASQYTQDAQENSNTKNLSQISDDTKIAAVSASLAR